LSRSSGFGGGIGWGSSWFFAILAPSSSFIPLLDVVFEHRMYLPLAAIVVPIVMVGWRVLELAAEPNLAKQIGKPVIAIILAILIVMTIERNRDYRSSLVMWEGVLKLRPNTGRAEQHVGEALMDMGRIDDAVPYFKRAIELEPNDPQPYERLGNAYLQNRDFDDAIAFYQTAAQTHPNFTLAWLRLGQLHEHRQEWAAAIDALKRLVQSNPNEAGACYELGLAYNGAGDVNNARQAFWAALRIDPAFVPAQQSLDALKR
jgi:tetratricopeptide (TPR) repeat protein